MECSSKTGTATKVFKLTNYLFAYRFCTHTTYLYYEETQQIVSEIFFSINYYYFLRPVSQLMVLDLSNKLRINNMLAFCLYFTTYLTKLFYRKRANTKHPKNVAGISYP